MSRSISSRVESILDMAEAELKTIIEDCLASREYIEMSVVAGIADSIRTLSVGAVAQLDTGADDLPSGSRRRTRIENQELSSAANSVPTSRGNGRLPASGASYPRFEKEGERLVKIGWSKKDRAEYEHKAPYSAVVAVCTNLRQTAGAFAMEKVLPMQDRTGSDIPSYQVYLVVNWLRQLGLVERDRDAGYTAQRARLDSDSMVVAFHSLPSRKRNGAAGAGAGDHS